MALVQDNNEEDQDGGATKVEMHSGTDLFRIKVHPDYGRYMVTNAPIKIKSTVIEEMPVMCAPWPIDEKVTFEEPLCLGCCMHMPRKKKKPMDHALDGDDIEDYMKFGLKRCSKCRWPVCSSECEEYAFHSQNECQLFVETGLPYPPPGEQMNIVTASVLVQLIRCLLVKKRNHKLWTQYVLKLQSETSLGQLPWNFHLLLDDIKDVFPELEAELGSREECCKLLSIININAFSNTFSNEGEFSGCSICLFADASMIAHSCKPNCWWTLTEDRSHRILIKASVDIQETDMITVCYSSQYSIYGTTKREEIFRSVGGFVCKCDRCLDPTEMGALVSGVLCENCMVGYKLPEVPVEADSKWICELCSHEETAQRIEGIVKALESRLNSIAVQIQPVPLLSRFLENCKSLVHNNHWIVTQTEDAIMKEWAKDPDVRFRGHSPEEIAMTCEYFVSICFHALHVRNVVSPGLSFHRARYLLFYARTRMARLEFFVSIMKNPSRFLQPVSDDLEENERQQEIQIAILREEYQEILQLYHEVLEYRKMSCSTDEEIRGEIEHLIKLLTPVVQMESHHRLLLQEIGNCDNIIATPHKTTTTASSNNDTSASEVEQSNSNNNSTTSDSAATTTTTTAIVDNNNSAPPQLNDQGDSSPTSNTTNNGNPENSNNSNNTDSNGCALA